MSLVQLRELQRMGCIIDDELDESGNKIIKTKEEKKKDYQEMVCKALDERRRRLDHAFRRRALASAQGRYR